MSEPQNAGGGRNGEALQLAEARFQAILDTAADGIITINSSGIIESFNRAAELIFGYAAEEVIGRNVSLLMPEPYRSEHDGYLEHYRRTGEQKIIGVGRTVAGRRKDGTAFPLDLAVSHTRVGDQDIFLGIVRDVSERTRQLEALREAEARNRAIVETAVDGIIVIDEAGSIEAFNPAAERIFGYAAAEVLGKNVSMLMPDPYQAEHDQYLQNYLQTGIPRIIGIGREVVGLRKDGSTFPMDLAVGDAGLEGRRLFTGIVRDISERKRADDALREAQKMESLGVLAGGIAHDFNNLLVGILGNAGLAIEEVPPSSPVRPFLQDIETAGRRAAELAHQMLAYAGKSRLVTAEIDLNALVQEMTHLLRVSIGKGVSLRYNLSPMLPSVEADATQIRQVIMNLVINASDAIGDRSGYVTLSSGVMHADRTFLSEGYLAPDLAEGDYVFLEVSDTGVGMSAEVRQKIFDPFFTTKFTGRGLGLAVVLGVVRGHRGAIKVYSEVGHGTTFKVLFPTAGEAKVRTAPPGRWQAEGLVLIVDDDETVRRVTARALQASGLTVLTAEDGRAGVDVFRQHREDIDLVMLDLTMPNMNGEEALREIRRVNPNVAVIIMSGYNESETAERFMGRNVNGFLQKPYETENLRKLVRAALEKRPAR